MVRSSKFFHSAGEQELNTLLKESMECLLVKRINLDGDETDASATKGESLEDAEIANQLYNLHNKILRMFILTAFDMSRDILITPKRIMYAKKKEAELYEQLMVIAKEKQQEIKLLISSTIEQMRDRLVEQAAQYVFKENTIFNLPQSISDQCALCDCCLADGQSEKCDSALQQSEEHCSCASDEPDYPQIIHQYSYPDNPHHEDDSLINRHEASQAPAASQPTQSSHSRQHLTVTNGGHPGVRLRRHHSMHSQHLGHARFNPYSAGTGGGNPSTSGCHTTDTLDAAHPPQRAHSQLHNFRHCAYNQPNCGLSQTTCTGGGARNQANFNTHSHQYASSKYASCDYADSGCASGNCCSCEPLSVHTSDSHQRAHRNSQLVHTHSNQHSEPHYHPAADGQCNGSPTKKDSFLKRLTLRFNKDSPTNSLAQQEKDHNQRVIEQLNELQIKDKQDYEDLKNHLNHLNHLDQLNKQAQQRAQQLDFCCNQPIYHQHAPTIVNNKQIKITLRDLCAAQNEIQEYILSLLNNQIANDIVNSVNILKKNYIGTLERTLTALESGVSSIAQREQLTTALAAAVEFDSPNKHLSIANSNAARLQQQPQSAAAGQRRSAKKPVDCTDKACRKVACSKDQPTIACSSYMTQQSSLDCDCTLTSNSCSSDSNSSFDDADDGESDGEDGYSFANRTHHEASDALKQILTAAYQVEINLKTNSGFFKLYWDKIRQLVFNCTVTLWKLNYANPKNVNGFCPGCCHSSLSLVNSASLLHNKTASCHSCPPIICNSVGTSSESGASLECCELNCGCHMAITSNCEQPDCEQLWISEQTGGGGDDAEPLLNDRRPKFKRLRQTSLDSYVKIDEQNHFLDSHCHHPHVHNQLVSAGIINSKLQFDSIIDWKRKVALEVLSNLNLARLSRSICGQFKDKLKQSHDQFAAAIRQLEQLHLEKRKRTEQQRLNLRKCFAPKIARMALESICLKDLINHGMPKLGE